MNEVIYAAVYFAVTLGAFLLGKYVFPNIPKTVTDKLGELSEWAAKFVEWAKEFKKDKTGEEKMAAVVEQLKKIADEAGLNVTEDQLKAIAQTGSVQLVQHYPKTTPVIFWSLSILISLMTERQSVRFSSRVKVS